jgi:hypothetical protein
MHHFLDESCLEELLAALLGFYDPTAGSSDLTLCEGFVELRFWPLDGRAVCAAMTVDGVLWVVIDPERPNALEQAREMLEEWCARYLQSMGPGHAPDARSAR